MLYVLATPLGNLKDISERAKEILQQADLIIAENPGHSQILLRRLEISGKKMLQFAEHNEERMLPRMIEEIKTKSVVIISDAGTPAISDPGFRIVRAAIKEGLEVVPIPGPNAAVTALSASGLPTDKFVFLGFVPKTEVKLIRELEAVKNIEATAVFYESPHRIVKSLGYIAKHWPACAVVVAREMTKMHEEFVRGTASEVLENFAKRPSVKGEITVMLSFK